MVFFNCNNRVLPKHRVGFKTQTIHIWELNNQFSSQHFQKRLVARYLNIRNLNLPIANASTVALSGPSKSYIMFPTSWQHTCTLVPMGNPKPHWMWDRLLHVYATIKFVHRKVQITYVHSANLDDGNSIVHLEWEMEFEPQNFKTLSICVVAVTCCHGQFVFLWWN
jgi:hypothetical protein